MQDLEQSRCKITELVKHMSKLPQAECPVTHHFAPNCYIREIFIPKDTYLIGKIHATEHFNIVLAGNVTVITAEGAEHYSAPHTFVSTSGVQKLIYTHDDCVWQTVHVTDSTDIDEIEKELIVETYDALEVDGLVEKLGRVAA